jgi:hypothetical protein
MHVHLLEHGAFFLGYNKQQQYKGSRFKKKFLKTYSEELAQELEFVIHAL